MSNLEEFLSKEEKKEEPKPPGVEWEASVNCQFCNEAVFIQTLYPSEQLLVWECSKGHKSYIENYRAF